jgi:hypothetical protein
MGSNFEFDFELGRKSSMEDWRSV